MTRNTGTQYGIAIALAAMLLYAPAKARAQTPEDAHQKRAPHHKNTQYFGPLRQVPVMPALEAVEDAASVFDKPGGRIVQVRATGRNVSSKAIQAFYAKTLPALGWQPRSADTYVRDDEKLTLEVTRKKRNVVLDLHVRPRPSPGSDH